MRSVDLTRACEAAREIVASLGLRVDEVIVLQNSNKLTLRLLPCDVVARVSDVGHEHADFELALARRLLDSGCPVAAPEPRGRRRGHRIDGFEISLWTYHETATAPITPVAYAAALERLHSGMASVDARVPHVTDRIAGAERLVTNPILTPSLTPDDRLLLVTTLEQSRRALRDFGAPEQLLHGEPHPGNLIGTAEGPVFIDLETCCRGPRGAPSPRRARSGFDLGAAMPGRGGQLEPHGLATDPLGDAPPRRDLVEQHDAVPAGCHRVVLEGSCRTIAGAVADAHPDKFGGMGDVHDRSVGTTVQQCVRCHLGHEQLGVIDGGVAVPILERLPDPRPSHRR